MAKNTVENHGGCKEKEIVVVMVPLPAQGHLNQLMHLSRLIASYGIPVHYVCSATHIRQAKLRVQGWDPLDFSNIHFHECSIPSFRTPPPDPNASTNFPSHFQPLLDASLHLREPIFTVLEELSSTARRLVVIHDSFMNYVVQDVPSIPNAESYCFNCLSAFTIYTFIWEDTGKPNLPESELFKDQLPSIESCFTPEFLEFSRLQDESRKINSGNLYNSLRVIEGPYLDLLAKASITETDKQWAVGPFNPVFMHEEKNLKGRNKSLKWLDKQTPNSVIFVSFGSTTSLLDEQIKEIATGLEKSEHKFIWVLRDADKGDVFTGEVTRAELPEGYEERIEGRGIIVRDWAPQLEILSHSSTGGFMSHCGWNSTLESITMGVPIVAWPMHSDQPRNAILITQLLKIGLHVRNWETPNELVTSTTIENAVRRLMDSEDGKEMRQKAAELSDAVKKSVMDGGNTRLEMDSFIAHICR